MQPSDVILPMAVVGNFIDKRQFSQEQIQEWVSTCWNSHQEIIVGTVGKVFFFYCSDIDDGDNLIWKRSACYQGSLIIFKSWFPNTSIHSFDFSSAPLWIWIEGIPLTSNYPHVACRALNKIGRVITFDNASLAEGPKEFLRAKVYVALDKPLIPRYFFEYQVGHYQWVDFRYEGVFIFCKTCGNFGYKVAICWLSFEEVQRLLDSRMAEARLRRENLMVHHPLTPCFTNKIMGLRRIEIMRTYKSYGPPSDEIPFFSNSSDSSSNSDSPKPQVRNILYNCSLKRKRNLDSSSSDDDDSTSTAKPLWVRRGILQPPPITTTSQIQGIRDIQEKEKERNSVMEETMVRDMKSKKCSSYFTITNFSYGVQ